MAALFAATEPSLAGTSTLVLQPAGATTDDSWLREDNADENNGGDPDLRVKVEPDKIRNSVLRMPLSGLAGKSVLRAWLELTQSAGNNGSPIDARIYPLTEDWDESTVTWTLRDEFVVLGTRWATPGGTHGPAWTDRALVSTATTNSAVQWQVGPVVQAWNAGWMTNHGFVIVPRPGGPNREVAFRSSDYGTASQRPRLVIQYTDEAPAIRQGTAEIQPRSVRVGTTAAPLTAWLDVDAAGSTPSGTATGFDALIVSHGGALSVTGVDRFVVGGASVAASLVTWTDDGQAVTFRFPRVRIAGQVQLDFRADVLATARAEGVSLPMGVDDSATPGAASQALWPGDADRIAGNGDDWILSVVSTPPTSIELTPPSASLTNRTCLALSLSGRDASGNVFPLVPDSIRVLPAALGTIGGMRFCATDTGTVRLVACVGALRDTSVIVVQPELLAQIDGLALRDRTGAGTDELAPGDTMFLDVTLSDGDGLDDVTALAIDFLHPGAVKAPGTPAFGASFAWRRAGDPSWTLEAPAASSWRVLPALCAFDTASTATVPRVVRLAFVAGRTARASAAGEWSIRVRATSATPLDVAERVLAGLDLAPLLVLRVADPEAAFSAGLPGANGLPLETPGDARLHLEIEANTPFTLEGRASDLAGTTTPSDTLRAALRWSLNAGGPGGGVLGSAWSSLGDRPAPEGDDVPAEGLHLWIDHPPDIPAQDYAGTVALRLTADAPGSVSAEAVVPTLARVVAAGLAARIALAEVVPHSVVAGTAAQALTFDVLPVPQGSDTGVDRIRVSVPAGYGVPVVTGVKVAGAPVAFEDRSGAGVAEVVLGARVTTSQRIRVAIALDVPYALDADGSDFVVVYDDQSTGVPPQTGAEGDANGVADENSWSVRVVPGPLSAVVVAPEQAVLFRDSTTTFTVEGRDALGHPVGIAPAWRVEGGIGSIGATSGAFVATAPGSGLVIGQADGFADTATVTVLPPRAIAIRSVTGATQVHQGQSAVDLVVRISNAAPAAVTLDTLEMRFSRAVPGDANGDFTIAASPVSPVVLPAGATTTLRYAVDVALDALTAPLAVGLVASGTEEGSGIRLRDLAPDSTLALQVVAGGVELVATQASSTVRPGADDALLLTLVANNRYPATRLLNRLVLTNRTRGPGDREALDAELGEVGLWHDDGDGAFEPARDRLLLLTSALDGAVTLAPLDQKIEGQSSERYFVAVGLPTAGHEGDVLDVELAGPADAGIEPAAAFRNPWPLDPAGGLVIDGMVAAQVLATPVGPAALNPGATGQLALDVLLPANGYEPDVLTRLGVVNTGTARPDVDIARLSAWIDDGDGRFSAKSDRLLAPLVFTGGDRWQLTGLAEAVPLGGTRVFVTVDASAGATDNATLKLALPAAPDPGVGMASGNSGPLDAPVANPGQLTVSDLDRVALAALPLSGGSARPGDRGLPVLRLVVTNNYATPRTLHTVVVDDATSGPGTVSELDGESRVLTLRADGDGNGVLDGADVDPVLAISFFQSGAAAFTGLDVALEPFTSRQLFVTLDVSPSGARDGDRLGAVVSGPEALGFVEPTTPTGAWPLDSGARWTIDGFVAAQVTDRGAPSATVAPGDGLVLALDVILPPNGYAADVLRGVRLVNQGSAGEADFERVQLWRDGGDGTFAAGGDDALLGPLSFTGAAWASPLLAEPVDGPGARLFVSFDVAAAASDSATVRFAIPVDGIDYESGNDGPVDAAIVNPEAILVSGAPLLARLDAPQASTIGQEVKIAMVVRNAGAETIRGITAPPLEAQGTAVLVPLSGPLPATLDLPPAAVDTFTWTFRADATGEVRLLGQAGGSGDPSGLPRSAPRVSSNLHRVYLGARHVELTPVQTMPLRVNRGQADVVPFSLTLVHPGGADASDVRVDRLTVRLEQESGAPVVPADLLARIVVNEGTNVYLVKTALETAGANIDLALATPAVVTGTQPATLSLRLDLRPDTVVPTFRVVVTDSTGIAARDATSGAPVAVRVARAAYPLRSDVASVVSEATGLDLVGLARDTLRVGRATTGAPLLRLRIENPGVSGISSAVRLSRLAVALTDSTGGVRPQPGAIVSELRALAGSQVLAGRAVAAGDPDTLDLAFSPPIEVAANVPLELLIVGDIAPDAPLGQFGARLGEASRIDARDANSRATVAVRFDPDPVVHGAVVFVEAPAESLWARGTATLPPTVMIGETGVGALTARLRHPSPTGAARLRADGLVLDLVDDLRRPLPPATYLDRVVVRWNGTDIAAVTDLPAAGNRIVVPLPGLLLEAGDSARVDVSVDVDASAPTGFLELVVPQDGLVAADVNTGSAPGVGPEPGAPWPLHSGLARLATPARELAVGLASLMPAVLAADAVAVPVARLTLRNTDPEGAGAIELKHLIVRGADDARAAAPVGALAARLEAWVADTLWARSAVLTPDSLTAYLSGGRPIAVEPEATVGVEIRMVSRAATVGSRLRLGVDREDVGVIQPASALLGIRVGPEPGDTFPLWTESGGLTDATLAASYANFPNPFAAGREATRLAYFMPGPGRVSLRILTPRGDLVTTLLDGVALPAGLHQDDLWDGRNGRGDVVLNGVYVAELEVRFDDGTGQRLRRKVAVVR